MTNEAQLPMMKNMLRSALNCGIDMSKVHCYILNDQKEAAKYNTGEFKSITTRKLEVILQNMRMDPEVVWVDNDIVFFSNCIDELRGYRGKFVMQDDLWGPCTGFFLARADVFSLRTIQQSIEWLQLNKDRPSANDQHAFQNIAKRTIGLVVTLLPQDEYPNGEVFFNQKRIEKAKMVHCNYLITTAEKEERLKQHGLWNPDDLAFNLANKHYI